ncbi:hypothetical protein TNCV_3931491 [Trichonephila clavipes]|nr:hypothetical protein TNCV_3931491 [Trichonephila clavipes]
MDDSAHLALNDGFPTYSSHSYHTEEALDVSIVSSDIFPFCKWTVLQDIGSDHLPILVELKWKQLTQLELNMALSNLDPSKSPGPDNIHGQMISRLSDWGKKSLLEIFNLS